MHYASIHHTVGAMHINRLKAPIHAQFMRWPKVIITTPRQLSVGDALKGVEPTGSGSCDRGPPIHKSNEDSSRPRWLLKRQTIFVNAVAQTGVRRQQRVEGTEEV